MANIVTIGPKVESQPLNDNFAAINEESTQLSQDVTPSQNTLEKYANSMKSGTAVTIEAWGDSTYYGHASGVDPLGTQVAIPAPAALQTVLRAYYNNNNITVVNKGTNGYKTSDVIGTWDSTMATSTANIIFMNYGINDGKDGALTAEQYRDNLRSLVRTARNHGKTVVLETPNVVLHSDTANDGMGNPSRSENIKQFAEVMRQVAKELNVPLIDNYVFSQWYVQNMQDVSVAMPDGMHPSDAMYIFKAMQMASIFIYPNAAHVKGPAIIPAVSSATFAYGTPDAVSRVTKSKVGTGRFAQKIKVAVWVETTGLDLYVSTPIFDNGSNSMDLVVDSSVVKNISINDSQFNSSNDYPLDLETLILENASPGLHVIELNNNDAGTNRQVGLYYLSARPTSKPSRISFGSGTNPTNIRQSVTVLQGFQYTQTGTGETHVITDIPTSRTLNVIDVEVTAQFGQKDGFVILGHQRATGIPRGGFLLYLNASGYLAYAEGGQGQYINITQVEAVDLTAASHTYRLICDTTGLITGYVDGVQKFTYTLTKQYWGGFMGFYRNQDGTSKIDKVTIFR